MALVNGEYQEHIPISDRGFQYGDGLFETIEVIDGKPVFLKEHLARLLSGCRHLQIPLPDVDLLTSEIKQLCNVNNPAVLKIIISRGSGGRGYNPPRNVSSNRVVAIYPFPDYPPSFAENGIKARFCSTPLSQNPVLAGLKHLNRLEQVIARGEWEDNETQEGIMLDTHSHVIEGTMSNLFYIKNSIIYTAPIKLSGVAGIIREIIMQILSRKDLALVERYFFRQELLAADEVFVCNSIIGIWPINDLDGQRFPVGKITRQLQQWLTKVKMEDITDVS